MTTTNEPISILADRLLEEKGIMDLGLDEDTIKEMKDDIISRLEDRVNAVILANLPPDKLPEMEKLVEQGYLGEVQSFCQQHIPNLTELISAELMAFRGTYLGT